MRHSRSALRGADPSMRRRCLFLLPSADAKSSSDFFRRASEALHSPVLSLILLAILALPFSAQDSPAPRQIPLPSSKVLNTPSPGRIGSVNSFPATIALSPDGRYAALLNNGYGTQQSQAQQSIAILDLKSQPVDGFSRRAPRGKRPSELLPRPGFQFRWQTSLCFDRFHYRPHGREARQHRQRHRGLQI